MCVVCGTTGAADVLINILLYVPYGVGLTLAGMRPSRAFALVVMTTFAVELLQYRVLVGRDGTLSDVLTNSLGGGIGIALVTLWRILLVPSARLGAVFAVAASVVWTEVLAVGGRALDITAQPEGAVVWWRPVMPPFRQYPGRVDAVMVDGQLARTRAMLSEPSVPNGSLDVRALVVPSRVGDRSAPMVWIGHGDREDVVLSQIDGDLTARFQVRGSHWRLASPTLLLPGAFDRTGDSTATTSLALTATGHVVSIEAQSIAAKLRRAVPFAPTLGWALLMPSIVRVGPGYAWLSALWIGAWLFPVGYWAGVGIMRSVRAPLIAGGAVAVAFGALAIVPPVVTGTRTEWWEWTAALIAVIAGAATAFLVTRLVVIHDDLDGRASTPSSARRAGTFATNVI